MNLRKINNFYAVKESNRVFYLNENKEFLFYYDLPNKIVTLQENKSNIANYEFILQKIANDFWSGKITQTVFVLKMFRFVRKGFEGAFELGMKSIGILPDEILIADRLQFQNWLTDELLYVMPLSNYILNNQQKNFGKWSLIKNRMKLWGKRYLDILNKSRTLGGFDIKLQWNLGATEKSCKSCLKLNGKVKRASYWAENNIYPQNPPNDKLECGGWNCDCELLPTDKKLTSGRMPNLP